RDALPRRGASARAVAARRDLRPDARNERARRHGRALQGHRGEAARLHPVQLCQRRHGGPLRPAARGREGVRNRGPVSRPRAAQRRAGRRHPAHHGRPRELRADDRPGDGRAAHGAHHEPRAVPDRRRRPHGPAAPRRRPVRRGTDRAADAGTRAAARHDRAGFAGAGLMTERRYRTLRRYVVRLNHPAIGALVWLHVIASYNAVAAQVGHDTGQSPYRDVRRGGVLVATGGYLGGSRGSVGVGISDGPTGGLRYEVPLGVIGVSMGIAYAQTTRFVVDPTKDSLSGPYDNDVVLADLGLQLLL